MESTTMADYIKREEAIDAFDDPRVDRYYGDVSPSSVIDVIKTIPAVDVRENVRGEWIVENLTEKFITCSICKETYKRRGLFNFCPNCGADMRGGEKDD